MKIFQYLHPYMLGVVEWPILKNKEIDGEKIYCKPTDAISHGIFHGFKDLINEKVVNEGD